MKLRTVRHLMKDGIVNVYKQKMMSVATICIIIASFLVLGIFLFVILNLNELSTIVGREPEVKVSCKHTLDDGQVYNVEAALKKFTEFQSITRISKAQALEKIKNDVYKGSEESIKGLNPDFLPVSFVIKLKDPSKGAQIIPKIEAIQGVDKVTSPIEIVNIIVSAQAWIKIITLILILILLSISVLIISNAIKLTVHSRRKEVTIMKYIGATDSFIRMPFIIEGVVMGVIGSLLSFILVSFLYNSIPNSSGVLTGSLVGQFLLVKLDDIVNFSFFGLFDIKFYLGVIILLGFILTGMFMGALGSAISIKKYLKLN